jgi:hypothetical protein
VETLNHWLLCDELTIKQAALLMVDIDPDEAIWVEEWELHKRPSGYEAAKQAIRVAVNTKKVNGRIVALQRPTMVDAKNWEVALVEIEGSVDIDRSMVEVVSLGNFLRERGVTSKFFSPPYPLAPIKSHSPDYLEELRAAIEAFEAVHGDSSATKGRTPKQALLLWLEENKKGQLSENARERIATVANWQPSGGAPKTPGD